MNANVMSINSEYLTLLKERINLHQIPFSERGSRLLIFQSNGCLTFRLAATMFGWSAAVFIDLAIQAAQERLQ